jgi:hypothetical protein
MAGARSEHRGRGRDRTRGEHVTGDDHHRFRCRAGRGRSHSGVGRIRRATADRRGHVRRARNRRCHDLHRSPRSRCGRRRCGWCDRRVLFAADRSLLWPLLVGLCALVLVGEVTNVVEVFLVRGALGAGPTAFGLVAATLAAGLVGGAMLAARARSQAARAQRAVLAAIVLGCLLVVAGSAPRGSMLGAMALGGAAGELARSASPRRQR